MGKDITTRRWSPGPIWTDCRMRMALRFTITPFGTYCEVLRACEGLPPEPETLTCGSGLSNALLAPHAASALRAYTSNAGYLRALSAGASRIDLEAKPAGTVTTEDEAVAKRRLAELTKAVEPPAQVPAVA